MWLNSNYFQINDRFRKNNLKTTLRDYPVELFLIIPSLIYSTTHNSHSWFLRRYLKIISLSCFMPTSHLLSRRILLFFHCLILLINKIQSNLIVRILLGRFGNQDICTALTKTLLLQHHPIFHSVFLDILP